MKSDIFKRINAIVTNADESAAIEKHIIYAYQYFGKTLEEENIASILARLQNSEPIQYILGLAPFGNLDLIVNRSVLIPRPETEEMCEEILKQHPDNPQHILDIGTGSGCIPSYLLTQRKTWKATVIEVSSEALQVAKSNFEKLGISDRVEILAMDFLQSFPPFQNYSILISNPPYISRIESNEMPENVLAFEPHLALFADPDPLQFYKRIANYIAEEANGANTYLYLEINQYLAQETCDLFLYHGIEVVIQKDFSGNNRFLIRA